MRQKKIRFQIDLGLLVGLRGVEMEVWFWAEALGGGPP